MNELSIVYEDLVMNYFGNLDKKLHGSNVPPDIWNKYYNKWLTLAKADKYHGSPCFTEDYIFGIEHILICYAPKPCPHLFHPRQSRIVRFQENAGLSEALL